MKKHTFKFFLEKKTQFLIFQFENKIFRNLLRTIDKYNVQRIFFY